MRGPILVTGAAGFVGSAVVDLLRSRGFSVVAHARRVGPGVDWAADLADPSAMRRSLPFDIAAIVHCAAAIPARSRAFARDNSVAAAELVAALASMGTLKRVVNISSVAVYKRPYSGEWIISEDAEIVDVDDPAVDPYARSKRASELAFDDLADRRSEVRVTHLRASSIHGPGMVPTTLLPAFVALAMRREPLRLRGPRGYVQNFVHVSDVADLAAALVLDEDAPSVVNVFSDDTYGISALAELVRARLDSPSQVIDDTDGSDAPKPVFVNARAKRLHPTFRRLADHLLQAA